MTNFSIWCDGCQKPIPAPKTYWHRKTCKDYLELLESIAAAQKKWAERKAQKEQASGTTRKK